MKDGTVPMAQAFSNIGGGGEPYWSNIDPKQPLLTKEAMEEMLKLATRSVL